MAAAYIYPFLISQDRILTQAQVYAMEWTSAAVRIWFFPPDGIPASLTSAASYSPTYSHPNTSAFGIPSASFAGPCSDSLGDKFFNHTIILNTNFCGGWAGSSFGKGDTSECPLTEGKTSEESCKNFVASNPKAFKEAYWGIRSLRVWQKGEERKSSELVNYVTPGGLLLPVAAPVATPPSVMLVVPVPVEDTSATKPSWVSPLTGGLLHVGPGGSDTLQREDPVSIDSGIGDKTFPAPFEGPSTLFDAPLIHAIPPPAVPRIVPAISTGGIAHLNSAVPSSAHLCDGMQSALQALANAFGVSAVASSANDMSDAPIVAPASAIVGVLDANTKNALYDLLTPVVQPLGEQSNFELRKRGVLRRQESDWESRFYALSPELQEKLHNFANQVTYGIPADTTGEGGIDAWLENVVSILQDAFATLTPSDKAAFLTLLVQPDPSTFEEPDPEITPVTESGVGIAPEEISTPASWIPEATITEAPFANVSNAALNLTQPSPIGIVVRPFANFSIPAEAVAEPTPVDFAPVPLANISLPAVNVTEPTPIFAPAPFANISIPVEIVAEPTPVDLAPVPLADASIPAINVTEPTPIFAPATFTNISVPAGIIAEPTPVDFVPVLFANASTPVVNVTEPEPTPIDFIPAPFVNVSVPGGIMAVPTAIIPAPDPSTIELPPVELEPLPWPAPMVSIPAGFPFEVPTPLVALSLEPVSTPIVPFPASLPLVVPTPLEPIPTDIPMVVPTPLVSVPADFAQVAAPSLEPVTTPIVPFPSNISLVVPTPLESLPGGLPIVLSTSLVAPPLEPVSTINASLPLAVSTPLVAPPLEPVSTLLESIPASLPTVVPTPLVAPPLEPVSVPIESILASLLLAASTPLVTPPLEPVATPLVTPSLEPVSVPIESILASILLAASTPLVTPPLEPVATPLVTPSLEPVSVPIESILASLLLAASTPLVTPPLEPVPTPLVTPPLEPVSTPLESIPVGLPIVVPTPLESTPPGFLPIVVPTPLVAPPLESNPLESTFAVATVTVPDIIIVTPSPIEAAPASLDAGLTPSVLPPFTSGTLAASSSILILVNPLATPVVNGTPGLLSNPIAPPAVNTPPVGLVPSTLIPVAASAPLAPVLGNSPMVPTSPGGTTVITPDGMRKREVQLKDLEDFVKQFVNAYHQLGPGFLQLSVDEQRQLIDGLINPAQAAKIPQQAHSYEARVKKFLDDNNVIGKIFPTLDEQDKLQLIKLLVEDQPVGRLGRRHVGRLARRHLIVPSMFPPQPTGLSVDEEPPSPDLTEILGDDGTLDPFGMLALNDLPVKPKPTPDLPAGADPANLIEGSDDYDPADSDDDVLPDNFKSADPFGMTGLDSLDNTTQSIIEQYFGGEEGSKVLPHEDEDATIPTPSATSADVYLNALNELPDEDLEDDTANNTEYLSIIKASKVNGLGAPAPEVTALPGKKLIDIVEVPSIEQTEVNGPYTGEMVKGKFANGKFAKGGEYNKSALVTRTLVNKGLQPVVALKDGRKKVGVKFRG
jgi:hypothetical protein